jgi:pilus assembly protein Flp/PilA
MNNTIARVYLRLHDLKRDEQGQDMVEYALLVSLVALLCIAGISHVAASVNGAFSNISSSLA